MWKKNMLMSVPCWLSSVSSSICHRLSFPSAQESASAISAVLNAVMRFRTFYSKRQKFLPIDVWH